jgi:hypothetical protein
MGFSAQWLALREPADHAARDATMLAQAARLGGPNPVIVDLACGTGSTLRAFAGQVGRDTAWRLVDHDADLLAVAAAQGPGTVSAHRMDLNSLDALPWQGATLVTASALLDLCARPWVERLASVVASHGLPFYAALSYDGQMVWTPADEGDLVVTEAFNRHQRGDKGFGPALGPDAARVTAEVFGALGYHVTLAPSPWVLGPDEADLQREFLQGVAQAAAEAGAQDALRWCGRRQDRIAVSTCTIGHLDLLAYPQTRPASPT